MTGWDSPLPEAQRHRDRYPEESDRVALIDCDVSVTPLSITHEYVKSSLLADSVSSLETE